MTIFETILAAISTLGFGMYFGYKIAELTEDTKRDLEAVRKNLATARLRCNRYGSRLVRYRLEVYKLNKALRRRTRQIEVLKRKLDRAGVPAHTPGTRPQTVSSVSGQMTTVLCAPASDSMDSVLRTQLSRVKSEGSA